ncbi:unnamed protein product [Auanema sp. JU1783]|nr:unnamed protein product [Auanema sp. JU1783]
MFRLTLLSALLVASYAQYASRPSTAMSQDSIPAWYQMSKQAASPSYPSFERRDQFERLDRQPAVPQHTNSYSGYPSYNTIRSGSTYTDSQLPGQMPSVMPAGPNQGSRRYPSGSTQDVSARTYAMRNKYDRYGRTDASSENENLSSVSYSLLKSVPPNWEKIYETTRSLYYLNKVVGLKTLSNWIFS